MGELDGVTHQVEQHLPQPGFIQHHGRRHFLANAHFQGNTLLGGAQIEDVADIAQQPAHRHRAKVQSHLAGLNPGQVQDVVNQHQQAAAAGTDGVEVVTLLGVGNRVIQQVTVADHRVHRRPDFMGHIGQEFAFGAACGFGLPRQPLRLQLGCPQLVFTAPQGILRPDPLVDFQRQLSVPVQEDQHHHDGDQDNPAHHGVVGFLLDIQVNPAVVNRLGFRCRQTTQGLVQYPVQLLGRLAHG